MNDGEKISTISWMKLFYFHFKIQEALKAIKNCIIYNKWPY